MAIKNTDLISAMAAAERYSDKTDTLYRTIRAMRRDLRNNGGDRMQEHALTALLGAHRGLYITFLGKDKPLLGEAIFAADPSGIDDIEQAVRILSDKLYVTQSDAETLLWQAEFAILMHKSELSEEELARRVSVIRSADPDELTRRLNPLERLFSDDPFYNECSDDTRAMLRAKTARVAIATGIPEQRLSGEYLRLVKKEARHVARLVTDDYRRVFPYIKPKVYLAWLLVSAALHSVVLGFFLGWLSIPLTLLPCLTLSKTFTDRFIARSMPAEPPARVDLHGKVPDGARVLVVMSALFSDEDAVKDAFARLKSARLRNFGENIRYLLLADLPSADSETVPADDTVIALSERLSRKQKIGVIIRRRTYSRTQRQFQGQERKRGAIEELVQRLKGGESDFRACCCLNGELDDIRYLAALDLDTLPTLGSIYELVCVAKHPLNAHAGIIAPRVTTSLSSSLRTTFSRITAGNGGCSTASGYDSFCGELYQDAFGDGIFTGKGLISVDAYYEKCVGKLPEERILSHDILEGAMLGVLYAGDVEFSDGCPPTSDSWFKRLNRWLRGDLQNFPFLFDKRLSPLSKIKLGDNVRRAVMPLVYALCLLLVPAFRHGHVLGWLVLFALLSPYFLAILPCVLRSRRYGNSRRFFSPVYPRFRQLFYQGVTELLLLPQNVLTSADALFRTTWRMLFTKRHLLDWTTSAAAERGKASRSRLIWAELCPLLLIVIGLAFFRYNGWMQAAIGVVLAAQLPVLIIANREQRSNEPPPTQAIQKGLIECAEKQWSFFCDYVTAQRSFLPPDNVQFKPIYRVAERTSPTNIGMYLLSCVAARELGFVKSDELREYVTLTISTCEKLEKYHGNLLNWYSTETLNPCSTFVSSVDSGNFCACLVAVRAAILARCGDDELAARIDKLIISADLSIFYNPSKRLFSVGIDAESGELMPNYYDLLMSESRLMSYFAVAIGCVSKRHWRALGRTLGRCGSYAAPVSWTGTMFEYFMPELLIRSREGSISYESLKFALACQKRRASAAGVPFGISESCYYAFDRDFNYQYKAHGVSAAALKAGMDKECVVSPYSTFLTLSVDLYSSYNNLVRMQKSGLWGGRYGFFEAADYTKSRVGSGYAVVKSYMSHHVGMSLAAVANALKSGILQQYFMSDERMAGAAELPEERIMTDEEVMSEPEKVKDGGCERYSETIDEPALNLPRVNLLSNSILTVITTDTGITRLLYKGKDCIFPTTDPVLRQRGSIFGITEERGTLSFTLTPNVNNDAKRHITFGQNVTKYNLADNKLSVEQAIYVHPSRPAEIRRFSILNGSDERRQLTLCAYLEPTLAFASDTLAHPAFMDLFLRVKFYREYNCFVAMRKERDSDAELYLLAGFVGEVDFTYSFNREDVTARNGGLFSVFEKGRERTSSNTDVPAPCIFVKVDCPLDAGERRKLVFFTAVGETLDEVMETARRIREKVPPEDSTEVVSPLVSDTLTGRLAARLLPPLLFTSVKTPERIHASNGNRLGKAALLRLGINPDKPLLLFLFSAAMNVNDEAETLGIMITAHDCLQKLGIESELTAVTKTPLQHSLCSSLTGGSITLLDEGELTPEDGRLLIAAAVYVLRCGSGGVQSEEVPLRITEPLPARPLLSGMRNGFAEDKYVIAEPPPNVWSNVLANPQFGTLVSDNALGYTWALNSHQNKLTPWFNDLRRDNDGERLLLRTEGATFDCVRGSVAVFAPNKADWYARVGSLEVKTSVRVRSIGMAKLICAELFNPSDRAVTVELAYCVEPLLGAGGGERTLLSLRQYGDAIIAENPFNEQLSGAITLSTDSTEQIAYVTDRTAFLAGEWESSVGNDCMAVIVKLTVPVGERRRICYALAFTRNLDNPLTMRDSVLGITTDIDLAEPQFNEYLLDNCNLRKSPNPSLELLLKHWLPWQTVGFRLWARTGFYQCGGAFGFRDQLQDAYCAMLLDRNLCRLQLLRSCRSQFIEGDVLHWYHAFGKVRKGARTRCSDDLLWLPFVLSRYVARSGDETLLRLNVRYCEGERLKEGETERYITTTESQRGEDVYHHAKRAVERAFKTGEHGLLLIGSGDWCDGYNRVGIKGKGESVWLTMFYVLTARSFSETARLYGDGDYAGELEMRTARLLNSLEERGWDGEYYLRAYYDDGAKMGGKDSAMCKLDLLPQAFAVLAGLPDSGRNRSAVCAALRELVDYRSGIVRLFAPAFERDEATTDAGYVMSYPKGVRENGGQYTHAAVWLAIACRELGMDADTTKLIAALSPTERSTAYRNEPYLMSADIYTNPEAFGRGGWSGYTGSAGWFMRLLAGEDGI